MRYIWRIALLVVAMVLGFQGAALACNTPEPTPPTEVSACWQVDDPSVNLFPQTFQAEGDANATFDTLCPAPPPCETVKQQFDLYWLYSDENDRALLDQLEQNGLDRDENGHPQDQPLSPHGVVVQTRTGPGTDLNGDEPGCGTLPNVKDAVLRFRALDGCGNRDDAWVTKRHGVFDVTLKGHHRDRWVLTAKIRDGHDAKPTQPGVSEDGRSIRLVKYTKHDKPCHSTS